MAYLQQPQSMAHMSHRQQYGAAPYSPQRSQWAASAHSQQVPATPPRLPASGSAYSPGASRTPQMIKCSTCACLVPLLDLTEHICKPQSDIPVQSQRRPFQARQYSAEAHYPGQSSNNQASRMSPHPLRLNVSHAHGQVPAGPSSASPMYIPPARSPASLSPSPEPHSAGLSPQYGNYSRSVGSSSETEDTRSHISRSPKSPNNFDFAANNNAGVGAGGIGGHMPFFEKYQRVYGQDHNGGVYGGSSPSGSMSSFSSGDATRPQMPQRAGTSPVLAKSPMSYGWSAGENQSCDDHRQRSPTANATKPYRSEGEDRQQQQQASGLLQHKRDQSDSSESQHSSNDSASHSSDHLLNYLDETPETSPEMPNTPVFRSLTEEFSPHNGRDAARKSAASSHQAEDDIIDSYPTPQAGFSARFGSLKIDTHRGGAAPEIAEEEVDLRMELEIPEPEPVEPVSPLLRAFSAVKATQATRSIAKGLPMSQSTPDSLAKLAGPPGDHESSSRPRQRQASESGRPALASKSLNQRRRSRTNAWTPVLESKTKSPILENPALPVLDAASAGLGLDARLDDLLKDMNRESLVGKEGKQTAKTPEASTSSTSPNSPPRHCDSCVNVIPAQRKAIKKDGQTFCKDCYSELYLPKCQKCRLTIESRAIGSGDGKIKGKYHAACFSCWECSSTFPSGDFYVFEQRPYCGPHYHELNGTMCSNPVCQEGGIEGPCVSLPGDEGEHGSRYHPACFVCSHPACTILLDEYHYILAGLPYCERHARELEDDLGPSTSSSGNVSPASEGPREYYGGSRSADRSPANQDRRRSRSLDVPVTSITELRKNAGSPSYFNRGARGGSRAKGPPPAASNRRAEKRRTVIQEVNRR